LPEVISGLKLVLITKIIPLALLVYR